MKDFVAVFDSGIGGLTVLTELKKVAPKCDFLYLADHAFCPYGTRSAKEIRSRVLEVSRYLKRQGAVELVVACNTASLFAQDIRRETNLPVFDVIYPTCCAIFEHTSYKKVALLATNATVGSGIYSRILRVLGIDVEAFPCSELVPIAEGNFSSEERFSAVKRCLNNFRPQYDAVVLGCTHFPLLRNEIADCVGNLPIVFCSQPIAKYFAKNHKFEGTGCTKYVTTGNASVANSAAKSFGITTFAHADV